MSRRGFCITGWTIRPRALFAFRGECGRSAGRALYLLDVAAPDDSLEIPHWVADQRLFDDTRAPDGIVAGGFRRIRKGGRVKFGGDWWTATELEPFVGMWVELGGGDYWQGELWVLNQRDPVYNVRLSKIQPAKSEIPRQAPAD